VNKPLVLELLLSLSLLLPLLLQPHNGMETISEHVDPLSVTCHPVGLMDLQLSDPQSCLGKVPLNAHVAKREGAQVVGAHSQLSSGVESRSGHRGGSSTAESL
jgi:hypothetical protein